MAGSLTDTFEVDLLKLITGQATTVITTTPFANVYVGLFTTANTESAAGTEVSGGSYARVDSKTKWAVPAAGTVSSNAVITFPTASASWGTVVSFALFDAITAGNRLAWADLTVNKTISSGDTASFASGSLGPLTLD